MKNDPNREQRSAAAQTEDSRSSDDSAGSQHETRLAGSSQLDGGIRMDPGGSLLAAAGEHPGAVIDRYELLEQVGSGGFGTVFAAQQREPVQRRVALKVIKLGMDTRQVIARFERERQTLTLMDHPSIAKVLDAGSTAAGRPYFVMEFVDGKPITAYCDEAKFDIPERLRLFTEVCNAVQHAHQKGVIHRDIKPGNVLVSTRDGRPHPKVIDFGIAKATTGAEEGLTLTSGQQHMLGTPQYMSPEQAAGGTDFDTRTDVYSLGVVLYELLCGRTPFEAADLSSASHGEIQRWICEVEPPRPSARAGTTSAEAALRRREEPRTLVTRLRGELDWIVMKALEKEPPRRYDSPSSLAADLQRFLSGQPVFAAPPSRAYRARKFVRRHRAAVASGAAMIVLLLAALGALAYGFVQVRAERDRTEAARREAQRQAEVAEAINEFLNSDLLSAASPSADETGGRDVSMGDVLDAAARRLDNDPAVIARFADKPLVAAAIHRTIAAAYENLGDSETAEQQYATAVALLTEARGATDPETLTCRIHLAQTIANLGREAEAEAMLTSVLESLRREHAEDVSNVGFAKNELAILYRKTGRLSEAEALLRESLQNLENVFGHSDARSLTSLVNLSMLYREQGRYTDAEKILRDVVEQRTRIFGRTHFDTLSAIEALGVTLNDAGKYAEVEPLYGEILEIRSRVLGEDHPDTLTCKSNLGLFYWTIGQFQKAAPLLEEVLEARQRKFGPENRSTLMSMNSVASCYASMGRLDEALPLREQTLEIQRRVLGPDDPSTLRSINNLAVLYKELDRFDEAEALYREALKTRDSAFGPDNPGTLITLENLGGVYYARGDLKGARGIVEQVLQGRKRALGEDHPAVAQTLYNLAKITAQQGDVEAAIPWFEEAAQRFRKAYGDRHEYVAATLDNLGGLHRGRKEYEYSLACHREALDIHVALDGEEHAHVADASFQLGATYVLAEDYASAEPLLRRSLELSRKLRGDSDVGTINALYGVAKVLILTGRFAEAEPLARENHSFALARFGPEHIQAKKGFELVADLYDKWDAAEPDAGHAQQAAEWRATAADAAP